MLMAPKVERLRFQFLQATEFHGAGGIGFENLDTLRSDAEEICAQTVANLIARKDDAFKSVKYDPSAIVNITMFCSSLFRYSSLAVFLA